MSTVGDLSDIVDIADVPSDGATALPSSDDLSARWERQHWSVAELDVTRDRPGWQGLKQFTRRELRNGLEELEVGETCVTQVLGPLVELAPRFADRLFL